MKLGKKIGVFVVTAGIMSGLLDVIIVAMNDGDISIMTVIGLMITAIALVSGLSLIADDR